MSQAHQAGGGTEHRSQRWEIRHIGSQVLVRIHSQRTCTLLAPAMTAHIHTQYHHLVYPQRPRTNLHLPFIVLEKKVAIDTKKNTLYKRGKAPAWISLARYAVPPLTPPRSEEAPPPVLGIFFEILDSLSWIGQDPTSSSFPRTPWPGSCPSCLLVLDLPPILDALRQWL